MKINDLINKDTVIVDLEVIGKKQLLAEVSKIAGEKYNVNATSIEDVILERESLGSTGMGKGIALPHGRIEGIEKPIGVLVKLKDPIDFGAVDDELVDIVFLLVAPVSSGADHLNALAAVSSVLKDKETRENIRAATSTAEICDLLGL